MTFLLIKLAIHLYKKYYSDPASRGLTQRNTTLVPIPVLSGNGPSRRLTFISDEHMFI